MDREAIEKDSGRVIGVNDINGKSLRILEVSLGAIRKLIEILHPCIFDFLLKYLCSWIVLSSKNIKRGILESIIDCSMIVFVMSVIEEKCFLENGVSLIPDKEMYDMASRLGKYLEDLKLLEDNGCLYRVVIDGRKSVISVSIVSVFGTNLVGRRSLVMKVEGYSLPIIVHIWSLVVGCEKVEVRSTEFLSLCSLLLRFMACTFMVSRSRDVYV